MEEGDPAAKRAMGKTQYPAARSHTAPRRVLRRGDSLTAATTVAIGKEGAPDRETESILNGRNRKAEKPGSARPPIGDQLVLDQVPAIVSSILS